MLLLQSLNEENYLNTNKLFFTEVIVMKKIIVISIIFSLVFLAACNDLEPDLKNIQEDINQQKEELKPSEDIKKEEPSPLDNGTVEDNLSVGCGSFLSNEHVMFGYPGTEHILERQAYVVSHDDNKKVPIWVSYHLTSEYLKGTATRSDNFKADPDIPKGKRAELEDYKGSGYDRGHIAPSADMLRSQSINDESFLLSNMCPQAGSFNRGIWKNLEDIIREWAEKRESIWIIAGPVFNEGYQTIGPNEVGVPQRFFKIVVSGEDCDFDAIAFVFPNEKEEDPLKNYIVSIDTIESETGLDFLNVLEDTLEEKIESTSAKELWDS